MTTGDGWHAPSPGGGGHQAPGNGRWKRRSDFSRGGNELCVWCMARPLGGPKVELSEPGTCGSIRVSNQLGSGDHRCLADGRRCGPGAGAAIYDMSTGRATFGYVLKDIEIFVEGWFAELIATTYDAELEKTHAYALFLLIIPVASAVVQPDPARQARQ
ncbi:MAG: hypothetical protein ACXWD3_05865 [Mycobacterium sp.]